MNRRSQLHKRGMRKSNIIDNHLHSKQNLTVVKENLGYFDEVFKLLTEVHQQHCKLLIHLNTVFTIGLERIRRIKSLHLNLQQS